MKRLLLAATLATITISTSVLAADVGVSISIGQPGFYGQIDLGNNYPPPQVIYRQPRIVEYAPVERPPIYLRVPPGHAKHWDKHCREYNACNERVFFVQDDWYNREYAPRYQEQHREYRDDRRDGRDGRDDSREYHRDEHDNGRRGNDHDRGHDRQDRDR